MSAVVDDDTANLNAQTEGRLIGTAVLAADLADRGDVSGAIFQLQYATWHGVDAPKWWWELKAGVFSRVGWAAWRIEQKLGRKE